MALTIKWPRPKGENRPAKTSNGAFAAFGRADDTIIYTMGVCRSLTKPSVILTGRMIGRHLRDTGGKDSRFRWTIAFRVPRAGDYRLTVIGLAADGSTTASSQDITVDFVFGALIGFPDEGPIDDFVDDFTPYGSLSPDPLGIVTMEDAPDAQSASLISTYSDPTDMQIWAAQFGTVPSPPVGTRYTYHLHAEDINGQGDDRVALTVG